MAFHSLLPEDMEKLKCALCQNYLSIPPITVISESGEDYKCGRCKGIETQVNIRNKIFESILEHAKFPCIYEKCKKDLLWGVIEAHEQECPHKTYQCNLLETCYDVIAIDDLEAHYTAKKHAPGWMVHEKFERNMPFGHYGVYVFFKNGIPYLIYYNAFKYAFWISVFSLKSKPNKSQKYELKISVRNSNISVLYENRTITPYNEREHCARCLFKTCDLRHHRFSTTNGGRANMADHVNGTIIEAHQVLATLGSDSDRFVCTINITDESKTSIINKPEIVVVEDPSRRNNDKILRRILQCPICVELMPAEIYTCETGHVICSVCKPQVTACPTCVKEISGSRNYALEELAENVELACEHQSKGCNFSGNVKNVCSHQAQCSYKHSDRARTDNPFKPGGKP